LLFSGVLVGCEQVNSSPGPESSRLSTGENVTVNLSPTHVAYQRSQSMVCSNSAVFLFICTSNSVLWSL